MALHLRDESKVISSSGFDGCEGKLSRIASLVRLLYEALAANTARRFVTSASCASLIGCTFSRRRRLVVKVPVLSRHSTSTWLSDSTAFIVWINAPLRARRTIAMA